MSLLSLITFFSVCCNNNFKAIVMNCSRISFLFFFFSILFSIIFGALMSYFENRKKTKSKSKSKKCETYGKILTFRFFFSPNLALVFGLDVVLVSSFNPHSPPPPPPPPSSPLSTWPLFQLYFLL
jgi:hypothetical protein